MLALVCWGFGWLPVARVRLAAPLSVVVAMVVTAVALRYVDSMRHDWQVFNSRRFRDSPIAIWIRHAVGAVDDSVLVVVDGYLVPQLHYATGRRLESYPAPARLLSALQSAPAPAVVVVTAPYAPYSTFPCSRYQAAYEGLLDSVADSAVRTPDFGAWWIRAGPDRTRSPLPFPQRSCVNR